MSTYLQYNNHMILHPTDSSKYLYGIAGESPVPPTPSFDEVTIGSQTWMAKNLAIDDGGEGIYTNTLNYGQGNVTEYYYTWPAAVRVAATVQGWHLPSKEEWDTLINAIGSSTAATKLSSTYGWDKTNGTDDYGFCALPAGWRSTDSYYDDLYSIAYFWTSTPGTTSNAYHIALWPGTRYIVTGERNNLKGYSVRLVKGG